MCDACEDLIYKEYVPNTPLKDYGVKYNTIQEFSKALRGYEKFLSDYYNLEFDTKELKAVIRKYRNNLFLPKSELDAIKIKMGELLIKLIKEAFDKLVPLCGTHAMCMSCIEDDVNSLEPDDSFDDTIYRIMRRENPKLMGEEFEILYINKYIEYYDEFIRECIKNEVGLDTDYTFGFLVNIFDLFRPVFVWSKGCF